MGRARLAKWRIRNKLRTIGKTYARKLLKQRSLGCQLQPAACRSTRRRVGIAGHRQGFTGSLRFGGDAQQTLQLGAMALGTFYLLSIEYERLEGMLTLLASVFVHRHGSFPVLRAP